uniref:Uncharacterized protein n=1 Tax=Molossus molossus TaxID=27622 RepID=A0A7J8GR41_MOLMO|nr:hypothetical protein HJG59_011309 [Molossus molossus]
MCGSTTYMCLPTNWTGTCTLVYLTPNINIVPQDASLPVPDVTLIKSTTHSGKARSILEHLVQFQLGTLGFTAYGSPNSPFSSPSLRTLSPATTLLPTTKPTEGLHQPDGARDLDAKPLSTSHQILRPGSCRHGPPPLTPPLSSSK